MSTWQLQTAKAKLSELLRAVRDEGPQTISVRGKEEFVVMRKSDALAGGVIPSGARSSKPVPKTWDELYAPVRGLGDNLEEVLRKVREEPESCDREDDR